MITFYLWNVPGLSLLIPASSGITYANQTGGYHTLERSVEGILLPLVNKFEDADQGQLLREHFVAKWGGWGAVDTGIDVATADFVDGVLQATPYTAWLQVDRDRLAESHEAWIYVRPIELRDTETIELNGFQFESGVLTWENSD